MMPLFWFGCLAVGLGTWALARPSTTEAPSPNHQVQVVGPLVLLRLQREGHAIFDLRSQGRAIPGISKATSQQVQNWARSKRPFTIVADDHAAPHVAKRFASSLAYLVPASRLETTSWAGVKQWIPQQLSPRLAQVQIWDVSEADEFQQSHLPRSRHLPIQAILAGERHRFSKNKAIVFT
jgi:hypothetical protein